MSISNVPSNVSSVNYDLVDSYEMYDLIPKPIRLALSGSNFNLPMVRVVEYYFVCGKSIELTLREIQRIEETIRHTLAVVDYKARTEQWNKKTAAEIAEKYTGSYSSKDMTVQENRLSNTLSTLLGTNDPLHSLIA